MIGLGEVFDAFAAVASARLQKPWDHDCVVFDRRVLILLFGLERIDRVPVTMWHMYEGQHKHASVLAAVDAGIGVLHEGPPVEGLYSFHGWRGAPFHASGHSSLWWQSPRGWGLQFQSSKTVGPRVTSRKWASVELEFKELLVARLG